MKARAGARKRQRVALPAAAPPALCLPPHLAGSVQTFEILKHFGKHCRPHRSIRA